MKVYAGFLSNQTPHQLLSHIGTPCQSEMDDPVTSAGVEKLHSLFFHGTSLDTLLPASIICYGFVPQQA